MLNNEQVTAGFNNAGIDTPEKLATFLVDAQKPSKRAKIEEDIAKTRKDFEKAQQEHNNKLAELQAKLNEVK
jgi:hypothetical protein